MKDSQFLHWLIGSLMSANLDDNNEPLIEISPIVQAANTIYVSVGGQRFMVKFENVGEEKADGR